MTTTAKPTKRTARRGGGELPIHSIDPGHWTNPRGPVDTDAPEFRALVESIRSQGLLEPVVVGPAMLDGGRHPLIAGWRRYAACQAAGQDTIDAHQRPDITDERAALRAALAENTARQDMTPSAEAAALARLMDLGDTQAQAAKAIGVSERTARERLRLLTLPAAARAAIDTKKVPSTATRQLQQIADASPQAAEALATRITADDLDGAVLLDGQRTERALSQIEDLALLRLSPHVQIRALPLGDDKDAKALRARARKAQQFGGGDFLSLPAEGPVAAAIDAARSAAKVLTLAKADQYTGRDIEYVAGADAICAVVTAAVELAERRKADRGRERDRQDAKQQTAAEQDPRVAARKAAQQRQEALDAAATPHAEAMNAEILRRITGMRSCALTGPVARVLIAAAVPCGYRYDDVEFTVTTGYRLLDDEHPIGQLADGHDDAGLQPRLAALAAEDAAAVLVGGLVGFYFADRRGSDAGDRRGYELDDPMLALVADAGTALELLPDRALALRDAHLDFRQALEGHQRDGTRRRILHELTGASRKGLQREALYERCRTFKRPGEDGLDHYAAANVGFHADFDAALAELQRDSLIRTDESEHQGATQRHHKITADGRKHRATPPPEPPVFADIDIARPAAEPGPADAGADSAAAGPVIVKVRRMHGAGSDDAELQPDLQPGRPNVRKVIYTASRTAAWVAVKRITGLPDEPAAATGRASGRRGEALALIAEQPGITIPELALRMGIKQNYLYRLLPGLQNDGLILKAGRGWHPTSQPPADEYTGK